MIDIQLYGLMLLAAALSVPLIIFTVELIVNKLTEILYDLSPRMSYSLTSIKPRVRVYAYTDSKHLRTEDEQENDDE